VGQGVLAGREVAGLVPPPIPAKDWAARLESRASGQAEPLVKMTSREASTALVLLGSIFFGWAAAGGYGLLWCDPAEGFDCGRQVLTLAIGLGAGTALAVTATVVRFLGPRS